MCVSIIKVSALTQDLKAADHKQKEKFNHISPPEELELVKKKTQNLKMLLSFRRELERQVIVAFGPNTQTICVRGCKRKILNVKMQNKTKGVEKIH